MSISVRCRNGHVLQVKEKMAGRTGLCPVCRVHVRVPLMRAEKVSEDVVMDILGPRSPASPFQGLSAPGIRAADDEAVNSSPPGRSCHNCHGEIAAGTRICPHCRTYVGIS